MCGQALLLLVSPQSLSCPASLVPCPPSPASGALSYLSNLTGAMSSLSSLTVCPSYYSSSSLHHSPQGVPSVPSSLHQGVKTKLKTITDALPPDLQMRLCGVVA